MIDLTLPMAFVDVNRVRQLRGPNEEGGASAVAETPPSEE